jgi:hypothetical protein
MSKNIETIKNQNKSTFWERQSVIHDKTKMIFSRKIEKDIIKQKQELTNALEFIELDVKNDHDMKNMADFLNKNYYDEMMRYTTVFTEKYIRFLMGTNSTILCLRLKVNNMLAGVICGSVNKYQLKNQTSDCVDISLFCIDRRIRTKSSSNKLMEEFKNRIIDKGYNVGIMTTNRSVTVPLTNLALYKRPLNPVKMNKYNYFEETSKLPGKMLEKLIDRYTIIRKLPENIIKMTKSMIDSIYKLYKEYMEKFDLHVIYTQDSLYEVLSNDEVSTYVIQDKMNNVVDFFSFYKFEQSVKLHTTVINAAGMYLHTILSEEITARRITEYVSIAAFNENIDLLYVTNSLEINEVLNDIDNNYLINSDYNINMYNWESPCMNPDQLCRFIMIV